MKTLSERQAEMRERTKSIRRTAPLPARVTSKKPDDSITSLRKENRALENRIVELLGENAALRRRILDLLDEKPKLAGGVGHDPDL